MDKKIKPQEVGYFEKIIGIFLLICIFLPLGMLVFYKYRNFPVGLIILCLASVLTYKLGLKCRSHDEEMKTKYAWVAWTIIISTFIIIPMAQPLDLIASLSIETTVISAIGFLMGIKYGNIVYKFFLIILLISFLFIISIFQPGFMNAIG